MLTTLFPFPLGFYKHWPLSPGGVGCSAPSLPGIVPSWHCLWRRVSASRRVGLLLRLSRAANRHAPKCRKTCTRRSASVSWTATAAGIVGALQVWAGRTWGKASSPGWGGASGMPAGSPNQLKPHRAHNYPWLGSFHLQKQYAFVLQLGCFSSKPWVKIQFSSHCLHMSLHTFSLLYAFKEHYSLLLFYCKPTWAVFKKPQMMAQKFILK